MATFSTTTEPLSSSWAIEALSRANFGVLTLDGARVHFINDFLATMLDKDVSQLGGKLLSEIAGLSTSLLESADIFSLQVGKEAVWLKRELVQTAEFDVYYFHNMTDLVVIGNECRRLQKDLSEMSPTDSATGMMSNEVILKVLGGYISKSRRYQSTLSLMRVSYSFEDGMDATLFERSIKRIAFFLKDKLRWADQIGMLDKNTFLVILPETDYSSSLSLLSKFNGFEHKAIFAKEDGRPSSFSIGLTEWSKGDDTPKMLQNTRQDVDLTLVIEQ